MTEQEPTQGRCWLSGCGCAWCGDVLREVAKDRGDWLGSIWSVMHLCGMCGNKRCPHASAHWLDCTGSNESGQVGSYYGIDPPTPRGEQR